MGAGAWVFTVECRWKLMAWWGYSQGVLRAGRGEVRCVSKWKGVGEWRSYYT